MKNDSPPHTREKFSVASFAVTIVLTLVPVFFLLRLFTPSHIWNIQWNAPWHQYFVIFLISQGVNCFVEWAFHRYMLHAPVFPGFNRLFKSHHYIHHLKHTNVVPRNGKWHSRYPIEEESQYESSYFPWFSLLGFLTFAFPFAVTAQWIFKTYPVLIVVIFSTVWSLVMYELLHAAEHWPALVWQKLLKFGGKPLEKVYAFHLVHHAHLKVNEAISGWVCGIPIADLLFGTFKTCEVLFLDGAPVIEKDLQIPKPRFFVRWLDRFAELQIKNYQARRAIHVG